MGFDTFANALGDSQRHIVFGVDEKNRELIPAVAGQRIDLSHALAEQSREHAQRL